MKILKKILLFVAALVALALIIAIFIDGNIKYEKSILINAPIEKVWANTNSLSAMNKWSPWIDKDTAMKQTMEGNDGAVGQKHCWDSKKDDVGKGCQTVKNIQAPTLIETDLKFFNPYESEAGAYVKLNPQGSSTNVTWGFTSNMPYPFRIMKLWSNMEKMIGPDYQLGLDRLKKLSEQ